MTYRKLDDTEYRGLLEEAHSIYRELRNADKYRPIISAASLDQYVSKGGVAKLLATYMDIECLLTLTDKIKDAHFVNAVAGVLLKERLGLDAGIRLKALNEIFTVVKANVHVFNKVIRGYFEEVASSYFGSGGGSFVRVSEEERREFCSSKIFIYPDSKLWTYLFEVLPDTGRIFTAEGMVLAKQSISMQRDAVIQVLPSVLGRFIDSFLSYFQEHLIHEGYQDEVNLVDWLWEDDKIEDALYSGLHAIEFY